PSSPLFPYTTLFRSSDNLGRKVIGRLYHRVVAGVFGLRVRDTDCDFRLIRRTKLDAITLEMDSGAICVELVRKLQDAGAQFAERSEEHTSELQSLAY